MQHAIVYNRADVRQFPSARKALIAAIVAGDTNSEFTLYTSEPELARQVIDLLGGGVIIRDELYQPSYTIIADGPKNTEEGRIYGLIQQAESTQQDDLKTCRLVDFKEEVLARYPDAVVEYRILDTSATAQIIVHNGCSTSAIVPGRFLSDTIIKPTLEEARAAAWQQAYEKIMK